MDYKVLFIVYHDLDSNGRSQQMLRCCEMIGKTTLVTYHCPIQFKVGKDTDIVETGNGKRNYIDFLKGARIEISRKEPDIVFLHDNYCASLIPFIKKTVPKAFIVYDSSELYIDKKISSIKDVMACWLQKQENRNIQQAHFVIAANIERARIMHSFFHLREQPYVFENIRRITEDVDYYQCNKKFGDYIDEKKFCIFYAGGISESRRTYDLIRTVKKLGDKYILLLAGRKQEDELILYDEAMKASEIDNVFYLGYIKRSEMRYLFNCVDISVSVFLQDTVNNINCASGKFFESVFEGCPVLTSPNPPLKRLCDMYHLGVSTDNFEVGIIEMQRNIDYYKARAKEFINDICLDDYIKNLSNEIVCRVE